MAAAAVVAAAVEAVAGVDAAAVEAVAGVDVAAVEAVVEAVGGVADFAYFEQHGRSGGKQCTNVLHFHIACIPCQFRQVSAVAGVAVAVAVATQMHRQ